MVDVVVSLQADPVTKLYGRQRGRLGTQVHLELLSDLTVETLEHCRFKRPRAGPVQRGSGEGTNSPIPERPHTPNTTKDGLLYGLHCGRLQMPLTLEIQKLWLRWVIVWKPVQ